MSQMKKKGKDEIWREINIIGLAAPHVSFGELRLSTITAQSLPRNPELGKRKPVLSFRFFFLSSSLLLNFSPPLCPILLLRSFSLSHCLLSWSSYWSLSLFFLYRLFPQGYYQGNSNSLTTPLKTPTCCIEGIKINSLGQNKFYSWCELD